MAQNPVLKFAYLGKNSYLGQLSTDLQNLVFGESSVHIDHFRLMQKSEIRTGNALKTSPNTGANLSVEVTKQLA